MKPGGTVQIDAAAIARRILIAMLVIQAGIMAANLVFNFLDVTNHISIRRIFNVAREQSLPTWYASLQALLVSVTAWALWRIEAARGWLFVSLFFLYVSIDDAAAVHERVATALSETFPTLPFLESYPSFSWHLLVAPILAAGLLAVAVYQWRRIPTRRTLLLIGAGLAAFAISQSFDVLEGVDGLFEGWAEALGVADYTVGHGFRASEEWLEMLGTTALWAPMLLLLGDSVDVQIERRSGDPD
jgi:hypothetical protein